MSGHEMENERRSGAPAEEAVGRSANGRGGKPGHPAGKEGRVDGAKYHPRKRFTPTRLLRFAVQMVFFILSPQVFSMAFAGARYVLTNLGKAEAIEPTSFVILLLGTCVYTVLFGRFFCGYACAFGTLGDVLYELGHAVTSRAGKRRRQLREPVQAKLRYLKYVVLVALLVFSFAGGSSIIGAASPWTAFGRITNLQFAAMGIVGTALLVLIAVGMVWQERFFCEYLCPLGAIYSLLPVLPFSNYRRDMDACVGCARCQKRCPMGVYPPGESAQMGECISCGTCCDVCPTCCIAQGTVAHLEAQLAAAAAEQEDPAGAKQAKATGSRSDTVRIVRVLVLAVVLLAFFWAVGAVKFLPALGLL